MTLRVGFAVCHSVCKMDRVAGSLSVIIADNADERIAQVTGTLAGCVPRPNRHLLLNTSLALALCSRTFFHLSPQELICGLSVVPTRAFCAQLYYRPTGLHSLTMFPECGRKSQGVTINLAASNAGKKKPHG